MFITLIVFSSCKSSSEYKHYEKGWQTETSCRVTAIAEGSGQKKACKIASEKMKERFIDCF